jgi:hypothetical protein
MARGGLRVNHPIVREGALLARTRRRWTRQENAASEARRRGLPFATLQFPDLTRVLVHSKTENPRKRPAGSPVGSGEGTTSKRNTQRDLRVLPVLLFALFAAADELLLRNIRRSLLRRCCLPRGLSGGFCRARQAEAQRVEAERHQGQGIKFAIL